MKEKNFKSIVEDFAKESGTIYTKDLVNDIISEMEVNSFNIDDQYTFEPIRNRKRKWK